MKFSTLTLATILQGCIDARIHGRRGSSTINSEFNVLDYVDPLIGTANGGHVFAGASLPFGMAKAVADSSVDNQGGFASDSPSISGFSHMHDSGTGGGASLGNFPIFPNPGCPDDDLNRCVYRYQNRSVGFSNATLIAQAGYFSIDLDSGIKGEITVTNHTALYRFTFPPYTSVAPMIFADLIDLPQSRSNGSASVNDTTGRIFGSGTFNPSFGIGSYDLHFCADFSGAEIFDTGVFVNDRAGNEPKTVLTTSDGVNNDQSYSAGAFTRFKTGTTSVIARVGMSFISVDQACSNGKKEIPNFDFDGTKQSAQDIWKEKLSVISIDATGVSTDLQTVFWSGAYRALLSPQDYTGENPLWESTEPYYDSYYCIWDSYRAIHQLITLVDPLSQSRMIRSLIDTYRHEGYLPDCRMSLCKGFTQGGSNADVLIAEAYLKNVTDIDWDTAYEAVIKDAEVEPPNWAIEGRGGLKSWKNLGYIPTDDFDPYGQGPLTRSISRTVEYAYDDYCIALLAKALGKSDDYEKYIKRGTNWYNMFDANTTSLGYTGFLQIRYSNGTRGYQDPQFCTPLMNFTSCYLNPDGHETYEGSTWLYTFYVPQDMASLITALGGRDAFIERLTYFHNSGLLYVGDEQAFLTVNQFHYGGRPGLSTKQTHAYIPSQFNTSINGIPGNDDSGSMGSFSTLSMMGLWPVHGQDVYLINAPFFREVNITHGITGKVATIRNVDFDPSYTNIYIQNVTRDGKEWTKNWIQHDFFENGGVLEIMTGESESDWGTKAEDLPPSMASYNF
ncbi:alpha-1,2-mannosidase, putative subfamily [Talaromyces stipitatus ATCC 10500]|uniref:Alpha-1,2-mannosidase, putative subfamily n=1 Tax=Talaromyces stipitatus (strain ATCC 10500 / CBS 375.48 / QM 6759 / NRRL 1006) TaxID=441959 RepID=B8M060_TALSN|nr:alpha-1,2-mannosidase, putative subfamily [Talaromyces stipitatus ATCC 10500]EED21157.1 alpha-1,2-mannosidase, putative subfamily [Talaromyces stipitatus ATCC 10500]